MSSVSRYADEHTLYVISGAASNRDLRATIVQAISKLERKTKTKYPCQIVTNLIYNREGEPYGFGYLYVTNPQIYHMLLGRNPDGSTREKIIDHSLEEAIDLFGDGKWLDWAEEADKIETVSLPSLMPLEPVKYTDKQKAAIKKLVDNVRAAKPQRLDPDQFDLKMCTFVLQAGHVKPVDDTKAPNILCARDIPDWLNSKDVYKKFRVFVKDQKKKSKKDGTELHYPLVTINKRHKLCFVEFDPLSRDAQFALLMTTKILFKNNPKSDSQGKSHPKPSQEKVLIFSHAFRSNKK